ncbi:TraB/GumN family protein [Asticcacaulis sp. SL142]|uniref:TraB/GumN family protein n=1 Tax=Asticcacaulis sp. SL142 TaxID=2995155 RepID=UPI00226D1D9B|nr:TraB/GumN family protein [Asticcacaulis sp. SL142]WAC46749.1 TraB/GumN family protein [Asticcacaulis sp. SL142]
MLKSFKTMFKALVVAGVALLPGVATAQDAKTGTPLMWVVTDADSTVYLLGSIHLLKPDMQWQDARIKTAMAGSKEMWLEIANLDDQAAAGSAFLKHAINPKGNLTEGMSESDIARLNLALDQHGIPMAQARNLKPWAVGLLITVKSMVDAGYDPSSGVDKTLLDQAKAAGKPVKGFETIEQQMGFFGSFDEETSRQFLIDVLNQEEEGKALLETMLTAWHTGDVATLERIFTEEMMVKTPKLYEVLLKGRNQNWVPQIEQILAGSGTSLIVVGTGHLVGPDGVPTLLKAKGVKVDALK